MASRTRRDRAWYRPRPKPGRMRPPRASLRRRVVARRTRRPARAAPSRCVGPGAGRRGKLLRLSAAARGRAGPRRVEPERRFQVGHAVLRPHGLLQFRSYGPIIAVEAGDLQDQRRRKVGVIRGRGGFAVGGIEHRALELRRRGIAVGDEGQGTGVVPRSAVDQVFGLGRRCGFGEHFGPATESGPGDERQVTNRRRCEHGCAARRRGGVGGDFPCGRERVGTAAGEQLRRPEKVHVVREVDPPGRNLERDSSRCSACRPGSRVRCCARRGTSGWLRGGRS